MKTQVETVLQKLHAWRYVWWTLVAVSPIYALIRDAAKPIELIVWAVGGFLLVLAIGSVARKDEPDLSLWAFFLRLGPVTAGAAIAFLAIDLEAAPRERLIVVLGGMFSVWLLSRIHEYASDHHLSPAVAGAAGFINGGVVLLLVLLAAGFRGRGIPALPESLRLASTPDGAGTTRRVLDAAALDTDPAYRRRLLEWIAANMKFDSVTHGQSDRNYMDSVGGNKGLIVAANRLHNTERSALEEGRVVWRIRLTGPYEKANLPQGVSYVYAYGYTPLDPRRDSALVEDYVRRGIMHEHFDGAHGLKGADSIRVANARTTVVNALVARFLRPRQRDSIPSASLADAGVDSTAFQDTYDLHIMGFTNALVIPDDPSAPIRRIRITVKRHLGYWWNRPIAKWSGPGTYHPWSVCDPHGCCEGWYCSTC